MNGLSYKGKVFTFYEYSKESEFENNVIGDSKEIFGQIKISNS